MKFTTGRAIFQTRKIADYFFDLLDVQGYGLMERDTERGIEITWERFE